MDAKLRALMDEVTRLVGSIGIAPRESTWADASAAIIFDRCRGLFSAVYLLVREGFAQEAMLFGRPLLTDSLALQEFADADARRRSELALRWELATLADLDGVWLEGQAQGRDVAEMLRLQRDRRNALQKQAASEGLRSRPWMPDRHAKELAMKHGRLNEFLDLLLLHHFVHGSHFAAHQRAKIPAPGVMLIGGAAADAEVWAVSAALSAAQSMLYATRAVCALLEVEEPRELGSLLVAVEALAPPEPDTHMPARPERS